MKNRQKYKERKRDKEREEMLQAKKEGQGGDRKRDIGV